MRFLKKVRQVQEEDDQVFGAVEDSGNEIGIEEEFEPELEEDTELEDPSDELMVAKNAVELREDDGPFEDTNSRFPYDKLAFLSKFSSNSLPSDRKVILYYSAFIFAIFCFLSLSYLFRVGIVQVLPTSVHIYAMFGVDVNVRGLEFKSIKYKKVETAGKPELELTGEIVNITGSSVRVPTIVFAFRDDAGDELYHMARRLDIKSLPGNRQLPFSFKVPDPPILVHSVELRFAKKK